jgi:hypothetical protein
MKGTTKALVLCLLLFCMAFVRPAAITTVTPTPSNTAIPPAGNTIRNYKPTAFANRVYHDATVQRAYFFSTGTPVAATATNVGFYDTIQTMGTSIGAVATDDTIFTYDGTNSRVIHNPAANSFPLVATTPASIAFCKFFAGYIGTCQLSNTNTVSFLASNTGGSELTGMNYFMSATNLAFFPNDLVGAGNNAETDTDPRFVKIISADSVNQHLFNVVYLRSTAEAEAQIRKINMQGKITFPIFSMELAGNLAISLSWDSANLRVYQTIFDIYSQAQIRTSFITMPVGWTPTANRVAISRKGYSIIAQDDKVLRFFNLDRNGASESQLTLAVGLGAKADQLRLNDFQNRLTFFTTAEATYHYFADIASTPQAAKVTDGNCVSNGDIKEIGVCEKCKPGFSMRAATQTCSQTCQNSCYYCLDGDSTTCTKCKDNAYLVGAFCLCKPGFYMDAPTGNCVACHSACGTCTAAGNTNCLTCSAKTFLSAATTCTCRKGQFMDGAGLCQPCVDGCNSCLDGATCAICDPNAAAATGTCGTACAATFHWDAGIGECVSDICDVTCRTCAAAGIQSMQQL